MIFSDSKVTKKPLLVTLNLTQNSCRYKAFVTGFKALKGEFVGKKLSFDITLHYELILKRIQMKLFDQFLKFKKFLQKI